MNRKYVSKDYRYFPSTAMSKVDVLAKEYDDTINFSLGDPDFTTDELIIEKAMKDAKNGYTHYSDFRGDPELVEEIRKFYKEEYDIEVDTSEIFVTAGGCIAMFLVLEAVLNDGDEVIMQSPHFTVYPYQIKMAGGVPVELPTYEEEMYQINMDRLEALITKRTKAIIINYPANPTGICYTEETLKRLAETAAGHDLMIISDEIYTALSYEAPFASFLSVPGVRERTVVINSFSKNFNMAGWRVGNIIAPDYLTDVIAKIDGKLTFTASSVSQRAALHALRNRKKIQSSFVEEYRRRVAYAHERVCKIPKMSAVLPQGTFYMFINVKETGLPCEEVCETILREAHVVTIPGSDFGECGKGYIRIACTMSMEKIKEAFDRLEKVSIFQE